MKERNCLFQVSSGGEPFCCQLKWAWVQNGGKSRDVLARDDGKPPTICDHLLGKACREGQKALKEL